MGQLPMGQLPLGQLPWDTYPGQKYFKIFKSHSKYCNYLHTPAIGCSFAHLYFDNTPNFVLGGSCPRGIHLHGNCPKGSCLEGNGLRTILSLG